MADKCDSHDGWAKWRDKRRRKCACPGRTFRVFVEDRSVGRGGAIHLVLSWCDISVDSRSIFIIKFLYKWARDASGATFFSGSLRSTCNLHPSCFISDRLLFPRFSARVRDVDEMSSSLISLWLMRGLINNSHFWWRARACLAQSPDVSVSWRAHCGSGCIAAFVNSLYYSSYVRTISM